MREPLWRVETPGMKNKHTVAGTIVFFGGALGRGGGGGENSRSHELWDVQWNGVRCD